MAASVKVMLAGNRRYIINVTGTFGGADETDTVIVDVSTLTGPKGLAVDKVAIDEIWWSINGYTGIKLEWNDTASGPADELIDHYAGQGYMDYRSYGGKSPTGSATGAVGDVILTSSGGATNGNFSLLINCRLK